MGLIEICPLERDECQSCERYLEAQELAYLKSDASPSPPVHSEDLVRPAIIEDFADLGQADWTMTAALLQNLSFAKTRTARNH